MRVALQTDRPCLNTPNLGCSLCLLCATRAFPASPPSPYSTIFSPFILCSTCVPSTRMRIKFRWPGGLVAFCSARRDRSTRRQTGVSRGQESGVIDDLRFGREMPRREGFFGNIILHAAVAVGNGFSFERRIEIFKFLRGENVIANFHAFATGAAMPTL